MLLYNTLTKKKETFEPIEPRNVRMYSCGPTVYGKIHVGNIRAYFLADILRRALTHAGYNITHVKNITDVGHLTRDDMSQGDSGEDKIEMQAKKEHKTPQDIARHYENYFHDVEDCMNILPAHTFPRATEHIPEMIELIDKLIASGHAYKANGNVFLDVTTFDRYGTLSGNTREKLKTGARLERHPDKRNAWDFALWLKAPEDHLMRWKSPWGVGYPGWHIECSAMSMKYLSESFDIHTGGEDNIFPHHEAEITQSECATGQPFVRYWVHGRHLLFNGEKMSKSRGTLFLLEDLKEKGYSGMDLRLAFFGAHYRSPMDFSWDALDQAKKTRQKIENTLSRTEHSISSEAMPLSHVSQLSDEKKEAFFVAINDDLNTPKALSEFLAFLSEIHTILDNEPITDADAKIIRATFDEMNTILGLSLENRQSIPEDVQRLLGERETAREEKNFSKSDALRDEIASLGYTVEDTSRGQVAHKS